MCPSHVLPGVLLFLTQVRYHTVMSCNKMGISIPIIPVFLLSEFLASACKRDLSMIYLQEFKSQPAGVTVHHINFGALFAIHTWPPETPAPLPPPPRLSASQGPPLLTAWALCCHRLTTSNSRHTWNGEKNKAETTSSREVVCSQLYDHPSWQLERS